MKTYLFFKKLYLKERMSPGNDLVLALFLFTKIIICINETTWKKELF